ncbi:MAG: TraB/GumN family protein [Bacteroidia bacterium]|nr:TraB/GumN family protein [Bacteroidia bacterium]
MKLFSISASSLCCLVLICLTKTFAQNPPEYGLLWEISGNGLTQPSYVMGSMHVSDERVFNFPDSVLLLLDQCKIFAMEIHPDSLTKMLFQKQKSDNITALMQNALDTRQLRQEFERFKMGDDSPFAGVSKDRPWYVRPMLQSQLYKGDYSYPTFLDAYLFGLARGHGKRVESLETVSSTLDMIEGKKEIKQEEISESQEEEKKYYLETEIRRSLSHEYMDRFINVYGRGDLETICQIVEYDKNFKNMLLDERNVQMVETIMRLSKEGPSFCVAGSAHLCGDMGIIHLLQEKGYTLRRVKATWSRGEAPYQFSSPEVKLEWITRKVPENGFQVDMPATAEELHLSLGIMKMHMATDQGTGTNYLAFGKDYKPGAKTSKAKLKEALLNATNKAVENRDGTMLRSEEYKFEQGFYREFLAEIPETHRFLQGKLMLSSEGVLYSFITEYHETQKGNGNAERFLNSVKLIDRISGDWKEFVLGPDIFVCSLPGKATKTHSVLDVPKIGKCPMTMVNSYDDISGKFYLAQLVNYAPGFILEDDSVYFSTILSRGDTTRLGQARQSIWIEEDGFRGLWYSREKNGRETSAGKIFLRGGYLCHLVVIHTQEKNAKEDLIHDPYFDTFHFSPFIQTRMEPFSSEKYGFEVNSPGIMRIKVDTLDTETYWNSTPFLDSTVTHYFFDSLSGVNYGVSVNFFTPFTTFPNADSVFSWYNFLENLSDDLENPAVKWDEGKEGGGKILEVRGKYKKANLYRATRILIRGPWMYEIYSWSPASKEPERISGEFLNSFQLTGKTPDFDPFSDKLDLILTTLSDTSLPNRENALLALENYYWDSTHLPRLKTALQKSYPAEDSGNCDIRLALLKGYLQLHPEKNDTFIRGIRSSFPPGVQVSLIRDLMDEQTVESIAEAVELLQKLEVEGQESYRVFNYLEDSLELMPGLYPALLSRVDEPFFQGRYLDHVINALDKEIIPLEPLNSVRSNLIRVARAYQNPDTPDSLRPRSWHAGNAIELLCRMEIDDTSRQIIEHALNDTMRYLKRLIIPPLLKNNYPVAEDTINDVANTWLMARDLYLGLKKFKMEDQFPTRFATQAYFAECYLAEELEYQDEFPDFMDVVAAKEIEVDGQVGRYFLIHAKYSSWAGALVTYVGMVGPFPLDPKQLTSGEISTWMAWDKEYVKWKPKKMFEHFIQSSEED